MCTLTSTQTHTVRCPVTGTLEHCLKRLRRAWGHGVQLLTIGARGESHCSHKPLAHHHGSELATILLLPYLLQAIEHRDEEAHIREPLVVQVSDPLH